MARFAGIDIPKDKRIVVGLTYVYGIGQSSSRKILAKAKISEDIKVKDLNDDQENLIRRVIEEEGYLVEGDLRSDINLNIKRLMDIDVIVVFVTEKVFLFVVKELKQMQELKGW